MPPTIHQVLKSTFGYDSFRLGQEAIIQSVMDGNDTLAVLPTGGGKSLCYQVPALAQEGICLVITPLIALMKDQVSQLHKRRVNAIAIHSGMGFHEVKKAMENACSGEFKFLYLSPERLQTKLFLEHLPALPLNLIAIDEAHCISQWGYDFRPAYLQIASLRDECPDVPLLALTASATERVQSDIMLQLHFSMARKLFRQSLERSNLSFSVFCLPQKVNKLMQILQSVPGSGLVYCRNRKRTQEIAATLQMHGISASFYHAGLDNEARNNRQADWISGKVRVMVCTNAFGMGIDKADVSTVVHMDLPDSLEAYYQEAGRAGRNGKRAYAVLLFQPDEIALLQQLPQQKFLPVADIRKVYEQIGNYLQLPTGLGAQQYFDFNLPQFCERFKTIPTHALHALSALQTAGYLSFTEQVFIPSRVQVTASRAYLEQLEQQKPQLEPLLKLLLRSYEGILDFPVNIREKSLAFALRIEEADIVRQLKQLSVLQALEYEPMKDTPQVFFLYDRVPTDQLLINEKQYAERKQHYIQQIEAMVQYATATNGCRSSIIRHYFGDKVQTGCGICDLCLAKKQTCFSAESLKGAQQTILALLTQPTTLLHLKRQCLQMDVQVFQAAIDQLLAEEKIVQQTNGMLVINLLDKTGKAVT